MPSNRPSPNPASAPGGGADNTNAGAAGGDAPEHVDLARWQDELAALLTEIESAREPEAEAGVVARLAELDPALSGYLVERMAEQESAEAAIFLDAVAAHAATPEEVRAEARAALSALAARGIRPLPATPISAAVPPAGEEAFYAGWVQEGRERGEQIMILGWRLPDATLEALVFLLDWRGDAVKDFYRTRAIGDAEWQTLVEHNGGKGAPLTAISLPEGSALLQAALAEAKRYSRPMPREYKLSQTLIRRRILDIPVEDGATVPRHYIGRDLSPVAVVTAYVEALHYRDFALAWQLLARDHERRAGGDPATGIDALRREHKATPRRRPEVATIVESGGGPGDAAASIRADGAEEVTERGGRRVRQPVRERYSLRREADGWRIARIERL